MPSAAPCPSVAGVPQKQVVKPPAVAGIEDVDDEAVAVSGLENAKVAAGMNKFLLDLQTERKYVGISAFLLFALRYRLRVCVWYDLSNEDLLSKYAPWASDAINDRALFQVVSCKHRNDRNIEVLGEKLELMGQGYGLTNYRPLEPKRREQFVKWTMTPAFDALSPAVAGIIECTKSDKAMFPFKVDTSIGSESWTWPEGPVSKQKLASYERFDPDKELFKRGAHMPLMIYIGSSKDTRRTPKALAKRAENAARRGWTYDRIQKHKAGIETSGGGKHSKGKGKHKGKGVHTHGLMCPLVPQMATLSKSTNKWQTKKDEQTKK